MSKLKADMRGEIDVVAEAMPVLLVRGGRGRTGGSTLFDLLIQRARHHGRRAKPLDGDLRSATLASLYRDGQDAASMPASENVADQKAWLRGELDQMADDRVSRLLDLGGGEQVVQEFVLDLGLDEFCEAIGVRLVPVFMLGPDLEDFRHVTQVVTARHVVAPPMLVLNEGVVRQGQTTDGVFEPILRHPDFKAMLDAGARWVPFNRLACMASVRAIGRGFYDVAYAPRGRGESATLQHMTRQWLERNETYHGARGTLDLLP